MTIEAHSIDLLPQVGRTATVKAINLDFCTARIANFAQSVELSVINRAIAPLPGYIAGTGNGIFTRNGSPAKGEILCMDAISYRFVYRGYSLASGNWMIDNLEPNRTYLITARDSLKQEFEPFCWDYVTPATDLSVQQQQELWESWQTQT